MKKWADVTLLVTVCTIIVCSRLGKSIQAHNENCATFNITPSVPKLKKDILFLREQKERLSPLPITQYPIPIDGWTLNICTPFDQNERIEKRHLTYYPMENKKKKFKKQKTTEKTIEGKRKYRSVAIEWVNVLCNPHKTLTENRKKIKKEKIRIFKEFEKKTTKYRTLNTIAYQIRKFDETSLISRPIFFYSVPCSDFIIIIIKSRFRTQFLFILWVLVLSERFFHCPLFLLRMNCVRTENQRKKTILRSDP